MINREFLLRNTEKRGLRSVKNIIHRYKNNGNRKISLRQNCGHKLTHDSALVFEIFRTQHRISDWAFLTLRVRYYIISSETGVSIANPSHLRWL